MLTVQEKLEKYLKRNPVYPKFAEWLRVQSGGQLRDVTIYSYLKCIGAFVKSYGFNLKKPNPEEVVTSLVNNGRLSPASMTQRTFIMRRYLEFKGLTLSDDVKKMLKSKANGAKRQKKIHPKDLITFDEVLDIITHTRRPSLRGYFATLYDTAARPGALCRLNIEDVQQDRHGFVFLFRKVKNPQSRRPVRILIPKVIQFFEQWWSVHPEKDNPKAPLFINQFGRRYESQQLLTTLKQHQERLGKNLNLYLFRKSRATQLLREKKFSDIEVKMRLGHKKHSMMLEQYYAIIDEYDQADAELKYMGAREEEAQKDDGIIWCPNCGGPNDAGSQSCVRCKLPLTEEELLRQTGSKESAMEMRLEALETLVRRFAGVLGTEEHKVLVGDELPPFEPVREDD